MRAGDERQPPLVGGRQSAHPGVFVGGVNPQVRLARRVDDGMVEPHAGQCGLRVFTRRRVQERHVCGNACGAQRGNKQGRLVFAVAVFPFQRLGRRSRYEGRLPKLDSGIADLTVQPGHQPCDDLVPSSPRRPAFI